MSFTYEAESAILSGPAIATNHGGFSGSGFADYLNPTEDYTEFAIEVDATGQYELSFRYALGADANRSLSLTVDAQAIGILDFEPTGAWENWDELAAQVQLTAGTHTVKLTAIGTSGPNLDALIVDALNIETGGGGSGDVGSGAGSGTDSLAPGNAGVGVNNAFLSFEQWVAFAAIRTGAVYQSNLTDFNTTIGGLRVAPLFDETAYLKANPDVAEAVQQGRLRYGFEHFVLYGMNEGRIPGAWFDQRYYLEQNPDVAAAVKNGTVRSAIAHFFEFGHLEQRNPNAVFDAEDYLLNNPDVKAAVDSGKLDSAFEHYAEFGIEEGRQSGLLFEESFYLQNNPDVAAAVTKGDIALGIHHFFTFGQSEGRDPSRNFDQSAYLERYGDVAAAVANGAFASGFEHYYMFGQAEGRLPI
ncbi:carbohydrate-binding protein [Leptolyngbya iicbica]|uniref:Carbohydrate-binding protein n=2 Tax=Cyanophyceae TaxID=3028117 RepID=A0A4Q7E6R7_9CYAN|nr:carbohydrate-binding protein [Leptolyngbya sp. LK]RZM77913.1 carbohydrate-binding protein [Leptolyngbya sp. LK]